MAEAAPAPPPTPPRKNGEGRKSGGYRTVIAYLRGERAVFLYGFAKNERGNIDAEELDEFRRLAPGFFEMNAKLAMLIEDGELMEVSDDERA